jgi:hypothetical protein
VDQIGDKMVSSDEGIFLISLQGNIFIIFKMKTFAHYHLSLVHAMNIKQNGDMILLLVVVYNFGMVVVMEMQINLIPKRIVRKNVFHHQEPMFAHLNQLAPKDVMRIKCAIILIQKVENVNFLLTAAVMVIQIIFKH